MPRFLRPLKVQIVMAIGVLTGLFAGSALYSMHVIDQQHSDDALIQLAGRLQYNQQHLTVQAMQYEENAPRDYPSYFRDLKLYFQDLKRTRSELTAIIEAFAGNHFDALLGGSDMRMQPQLPTRSQAVAGELNSLWQEFTTRLDERIGADDAQPRLEWAAEWITQQHAALEEASGRLLSTLESDVAERARRANMVSRLMLGLAILVAIGIAVWFYLRVVQPLACAVDGFKKVANGDFAYQVPIARDNEIGWLVGAFNRLSYRLDTLRRLLTRIEQGGDLDSTLRILSEMLPELMPVDWIGILIIGVDGRIHLEQAFSDGEPDPIGQHSYDTDHTLLDECIRTRQPLHIADVAQTAQLSDNYMFLRRLQELGRRDALFLPVDGGGSVHGVAVFASRFPNSYRPDHLELLRNLGVLVGVSLGRTLQLVESTRLASIGQFASGIVHEIRNPLATISLALEHVRGLEQLPAGSEKRLALANAEVARLERLLADILLYAKPLALNRSSGDIVTLLRQTVAAEDIDPARLQIETQPCPPTPFDSDRIRQVLINLVQNALQASPDDAAITIRCRPTDTGWVQLEIGNAGEIIPPKTLERAFEPFFTSKSGGTGLGLAIVRRIVAAHGGEIELTSTRKTGTRAVMRLPAPAGAGSIDQAADEAG